MRLFIKMVMPAEQIRKLLSVAIFDQPELVDILKKDPDAAATRIGVSITDNESNILKQIDYDQLKDFQKNVIEAFKNVLETEQHTKYI